MKLRKKFRIAHKEIGHETDLFFHLPEEVFEICHQHKMIRIGQVTHPRFIGNSTVKHFAFIQPEYIVRQTVFVRC